ncbi:MAG: signal recognition particle protein [Betaproteobacteria bacterium]|nr:signal recognition particle protein [Betaproteobacteria bacterium]NBT74730.1 signal recognition particle protein [Betaproteobacteria bacterium]NCA15551.1 signal recognition particle protein [Betaproteobacteria bacterium]
MLQTLTERFDRALKTIRGEARLTESNTQEMLREIRLALLDADVALPVVKSFIHQVRERALGQDVQASLTPGQALVGAVHRELVALMAGASPAEAGLQLATTPPAIVLMAGLQGAGKTTTVGKLAKWLTERKKKVLTVSCDVYRPAAIEQLRIITGQAGADFFPSSEQDKPVDIARAAIDWAKRHFHDVLIIDTAGRLAIDEAMMDEIAELHRAVRPIETLFTVDAMQGQDAVRTAEAFRQTIPLTGVMLTKVDGDARGGAVLTVRSVTGCPIKFVGTSEKIDGLEAFDPERFAQRILGMGDVLALVEQAQKSIDVKAAERVAAKLKSGAKFDLEDFKLQIGQMRSMGGLASMLDKLPAQMQAATKGKDLSMADRSVRRMEGIINAMTPGERRNPLLIKASRKRRIAAGAGVQVQEVNRLLSQFEQMQDMMKKMQKGGLGKMMKALGGMRGMPPGFGGR